MTPEERAKAVVERIFSKKEYMRASFALLEIAQAIREAVKEEREAIVDLIRARSKI